MVPSIVVANADLALGKVSEPAPLAPRRWWDSQAVAPTILRSPPPSTAYVMTRDTTPLPADATVVRKPEVDWSRPPPETQASAETPNVLTGTATAPVPTPHPLATRGVPLAGGGTSAYSPPAPVGVYAPVR